MHTLRTCWLHHLRWPEVRAYLQDSDLALIPIGATEQHGRHLPLAVDTGWAIAASEIAARARQCIVAPPLHLGWSPHHMGYPGTLTLGADTLRQVTCDVAHSLIYHGFKRLIIVNGNRIANLPPLEIAAVQIQNDTGARVAVADAGLLARTEVKRLCESADGGLDHAGEAETSFAQHWLSEHVDSSETGHRRSAPNTRSKFDYPVELDPELNANAVSRFATPQQHRAATAPDGHVGDFSLASADKGKAMVEEIGTQLALFIDEFRALEVGEVCARLPS